MENDYVTKAEAAATKVELLERMEGNKLDLLERLEKVETTLLKEFRSGRGALNLRVRVNELTVAGLHERMGLIEERVSELENPSST